MKEEASPKNSRITLLRTFHLVANIPYGGVGVRDVDKMVCENVGSCSTKHVLLASLLNNMGFEVRCFIGQALLWKINGYLPSYLHAERDVVDYHNFLRVLVDGEWLVVDATFGKRESLKGFPTNVGWDGYFSCQILFPVENEVEVKDIFKSKDKAISNLGDKLKSSRKKFFRDLMSYL